MQHSAQAMTLASFIGDSLALGVHWVYDPMRIQTAHGQVDSLLPPAPGSHHQGKRDGDFTHYGDQTFVLLESVAACKGFDLEDFAARWQRLFADYAGYLDKASRKTLQHFAEGRSPRESGSDSMDLAGASRIAPLVCALRHDPEALEEAARAQTTMTHASADVVEAAVFFARTGLLALRGQRPRAALEAAASDASTNLQRRVEQGLAATDTDTVATIQRFGASCHVDQALPGTVHCISMHESDPKTALVQCVMAGGDSAARAMLVGMVLAAWPSNAGLETFPKKWISGLRRGQEIAALAASLCRAGQAFAHCGEQG
jgi:ADP-ribosylglycohydrolase